MSRTDGADKFLTEYEPRRPNGYTESTTQKKEKSMARLAVIEAALSSPMVSIPAAPTVDSHGPQKRSSSTEATPTADTKRARVSDSTVAPVFLSKEQMHVLALVEQGQNVFYTGSAGTGKSMVLRSIVTNLRQKYKGITGAVAVTASTGLAAYNIGGITTHAFLGAGISRKEPKELLNTIKQHQPVLERWRATKVLIIDEVSLIDGDLFDRMEHVARLIFNNDEPFGGLQVILTGDFYQLPPIGKHCKFAFEAKKWSTVIQHTIMLTKVFRQADEEFATMLNEMRLGELSPNTIEIFEGLKRPVIYQDGIEPTELFPKRVDVAHANSKRLDALGSKKYRYIAEDRGVLDPTLMAPRSLDLCVNAQVMLVKNFDEVLVNGVVGRVIDFVDPARSQELDTVGASAHREAFMKNQCNSIGNMLPVVEFTRPDGKACKVLVLPDVWSVESPKKELLGQRLQLPLILAWALSIHKSQGQTIARCKVDLKNVFEKGQAYVALSRAVSLDCLQVLNFDAERVVAHPKVLNWTKTLTTITE